MTEPTEPPSRPTAKTLPTSSRTTTSPPPTTTSIVPATSGTSGGQQTTFVSNVPNVRIEDDRGREPREKSVESVTGTADRETGDNLARRSPLPPERAWWPHGDPASVERAAENGSSPIRPPRRRIGSAGRLAALHAGVAVLALGVVVVALVHSFSASYESAAAADIAAQMRQFVSGAVARPAPETLKHYAVRFLESHPLAAGDTVVVSIVGSGLIVIGNSAPLVRDRRIATWFSSPPLRTQAFATTIAGTPLEVVAAPIRIGSRPAGTYIAANELSVFAAERSRVVAISLAEAGVALLVGVTSAFFLLRRLLRTIGAMTETAKEIGSAALDQRLGDPGTSDEVGELAQTFDAMLDRLDTAMTAQRRLLADVSHQLRTPLTVARGHLELLIRRPNAGDAASNRETLALVIDELDHMTTLIERLLMLGRAMEPEFLAPTPVELGELLSSTAASVGILAPRHYVVAASPPLTVFVDRDQLRGAVVNLLENAVHATAADDSISVAARRVPETGTVELVVEDSGAGIPASERDAALQRFARPGARDADGSGLGLAIVKAVAIAHGGSIAIDQSPMLGGARVKIVLPASSLVGVEH